MPTEPPEEMGLGYSGYFVGVSIENPFALVDIRAFDSAYRTTAVDDPCKLLKHWSELSWPL